MWVMLGTRRDIAFAVGWLCQFNVDPTEEHWGAAKQVLRYLQGTKYLALHYGNGTAGKLQGYSDSVCAGH